MDFLPHNLKQSTNAPTYLHRNLSNFLDESLMYSKGDGDCGVVTQTAASCGLKVVEGTFELVNHLVVS